MRVLNISMKFREPLLKFSLAIVDIMHIERKQLPEDQRSLPETPTRDQFLENLH